jgi:hypothetical protein
VTNRPLDQLSPESRAVLSLVLLQSRSYADIADLLRLKEAEVRDRAHIAASDLVAPTDSLGVATRARIIDYMLGEQTVSERAETRAELGASTVARDWATELAAALAPLAKTPLPAIPGPPVMPVTAVAAPVARAAPVRRPAAPVARAATVRRPAAPAPPARQRARVLTGPREARPRHRGPSIARSRYLLAGLLAVVALVVVIVAVASSGSGTTHHPARSHTVRKLVLEPAGTNHNALGAADLVRQKGGSLLLLLQARGLQPNRHNAYAVWLYNAPGDARLLGFVSPAVGAAGTFSSGVQLPDDAFRFHLLIVTLERSSQPRTPGPTVLRTALSLS